MRKENLFILFITLFLHPTPSVSNNSSVKRWERKELHFETEAVYDNPIYDVDFFGAEFKSPSGRSYLVRGFWDGEESWKVRFMPDETGRWSYRTICSDSTNSDLNKVEGRFRCRRNRSREELYRRGALKHNSGTYHLSYSDNTPFLYIGCTAWNGALLSTAEEWDSYLENRKESGYSVIQLVTTEWRGAQSNSSGEKAFEGVDKIMINPSFFKQMDSRIERVNQFGLVAAPIMLWAFHETSPGVFLPEESAIKLAEYILARYDGNHVLWNLGGDGKFTGENEQRWKNIGRTVFNESYHRRNLVTLHARGFSWYGSLYDDEPWLDFISYQTGHSNSDNFIRWKTEGPVVSEWQKLTPRPIIDSEPVYENGGNAKEVRNSAYWSIFSTAVAGLSYGSWTIWPWLRKGDKILNHGSREPSLITWYDALFHDGSIQIGYLSNLFRQFEWWRLRPANQLLTEQPGRATPSRWQSVLATENLDIILIYLPVKDSVKVKGINATNYTAYWFNTATNSRIEAAVAVGKEGVEAESPIDSDALLVLTKNCK